MALNKEAKKRMEGLVNKQWLSKFRMGIEGVVSELISDGFETEDIEKFLAEELKETLEHHKK